ncbi:3-hydroxyacyl-CoA dehydrogenase family protein [Pseudonocardia acaciae]|uniref:3-hydroxyacyl-CoA dehydrogenase family protein n=1 Tax=Pseudonocardia acaciae TaxID=551276 RepID=UPI00048E77AE|nr:3-hydroxyacyl-CoA dehydrogenase family protein [Pseudonocardia acaciae]
MTYTVGVLGGGTMGSGIAVVAARAGHRTILRDLDDERVGAGLDRVTSFLDKSAALGKLPSDVAEKAKSGLSGATDLADLADCDVVIEAIFEDVELKRRTFAELDEICKPDTLFHTNTSTLSVTAIAAGSSRPERVVGTHYCNPAPLMKLVEVVTGRQTGADAYERTRRFLDSLGKTSVTVKDSPGFLVNRFLIPFENNCIRALEAGRGTVESIDKAVRFGLGYPMGPFTLLDIVGLDIHRAVSLSLYEQLRDQRFAPPPLVEQMIAAGHLGRKTGRGFHTYDDARHFGS